jgi:hypothetical protein
MEGFNMKHTGQNVLLVLFVIYLVAGYNMPEPVANFVNTLVGKFVLISMVVYLFMKTNIVLTIAGILVVVDMIRRSALVTGIDALQRFMPTEEKKMSQFTAYNQFPYTLEQEVVKKMAPIVQTGFSFTPASYAPVLVDLHDASSLTESN